MDEGAGKNGKPIALASRMVFYGMAAVMAVAFVVSLVAMPGGKVETEVEDFGEPTRRTHLNRGIKEPRNG